MSRAGAATPLGTKAHWPDCCRGTTIGRIMSVQEDTNAAEHPAHLTPPRRGAHNGQSRSPATMKLLRRPGLTYIATEELTIRRLRHGRGFRYVAADGTLPGQRARRQPLSARDRLFQHRSEDGVLHLLLDTLAAFGAEAQTNGLAIDRDV